MMTGFDTQPEGWSMTRIRIEYAIARRSAHCVEDVSAAAIAVANVAAWIGNGEDGNMLESSDLSTDVGNLPYRAVETVG